ncbi:glutathione S-transferase family protein [Glacieibacterium megasporae]|uniref:glutathione S-transferase family protein n=1 Tax=Glacieibacterium megasporae TaxID=2835787 RepID=UPI001C1DFF59|nr:glutathione S-transferase C-terminal domain-containing protein [Polymorphobacter megasporae]UAJ10547.1 glutathione S-transferase C-terminal domain-containing protein [Polymorphobacter megasporae]
MIKLYYHRGACSTSNHIALEEAGIEYEAFEVDLKASEDPLTILVRALNPMAQTPVLVLDGGQVLTQNVATLPFIADLAPRVGLLPERGTIERAQAESWLAFVASDLHPTIVEYAYISLSDDVAERARSRRFYESRVDRRLKILENRFASEDFILGDAYSVIDGYALVVLGWSEPAKLSLAPYPNVRAYMARIEARSAVRSVRQKEGPIVW